MRSLTLLSLIFAYISTVDSQCTRVQRYPPVALTSATSLLSGQACGNGQVDITSSSPFTPESAFDRDSTTFWNTNEAYSNCADPSSIYMIGNVSTTLVDRTRLLGDWLQIQFPYRITSNYYTIQSVIGPGRRHPFSFALVGSNNGSSWNRISLYTNLTKSTVGLGFPNVMFNVSASTTSAYSYFRLIILSGKFLMVQGRWQCVPFPNYRYLPVRVNVLGDIECMSPDATGCSWQNTQTDCENAIKNTAMTDIQPLACGDRHLALYGAIGYSTDGHWCQVARAQIDKPSIYLSELSIFGIAGTSLLFDLSS